MSKFNFPISLTVNSCIIAVFMILTKTHAIVLATGEIHVLGTFLLWSAGSLCATLIEQSITRHFNRK